MRNPVAATVVTRNHRDGNRVTSRRHEHAQNFLSQGARRGRRRRRLRQRRTGHEQALGARISQTRTIVAKCIGR